MEFSSKSFVEPIDAKDPIPSLTIDSREMKRLVNGEERHIIIEVSVISIAEEDVQPQSTSMGNSARAIEELEPCLPQAKRPKKVEPERCEPQPGPSGLNHSHLKISDVFTLKSEPNQRSDNSNVQVIEGPKNVLSHYRVIIPRKRSRYDSSSDDETNANE